MTQFVPEFDHILEGYVRNHLKRNYWKVASSMTYEDALQEARYCFCYLVQKYQHVDTPEWFMSLFKRAWFTHFQDLAYKDSRYRQAVPLSSLLHEDSETLEYDPVGEIDIDSTSIWLRQLPSELRAVVEIVFSAPAEVIDLIVNSLGKRGKRRETANAKACEALGLPADTPVLSMVAKVRSLA